MNIYDIFRRPGQRLAPLAPKAEVDQSTSYLSASRDWSKLGSITSDKCVDDVFYQSHDKDDTFQSIHRQVIIPASQPGTLALDTPRVNKNVAELSNGLSIEGFPSINSVWIYQRPPLEITDPNAVNAYKVTHTASLLDNTIMQVDAGGVILKTSAQSQRIQTDGTVLLKDSLYPSVSHTISPDGKISSSDSNLGALPLGTDYGSAITVQVPADSGQSQEITLHPIVATDVLKIQPKVDFNDMTGFVPQDFLLSSDQQIFRTPSSSAPDPAQTDSHLSAKAVKQLTEQASKIAIDLSTYEEANQTIRLYLQQIASSAESPVQRKVATLAFETNLRMARFDCELTACAFGQHALEVVARSSSPTATPRIAELGKLALKDAKSYTVSPVLPLLSALSDSLVSTPDRKVQVDLAIGSLPHICKDTDKWNVARGAFKLF